MKNAIRTKKGRVTDVQTFAPLKSLICSALSTRPCVLPLLGLCLFLVSCGGGIDPPKNVPPDYSLHEGNKVALALPSAWTSTPVSAEDFVKMAEKFRNTNPELAARMEEMSKEIKTDTLRFWANHNTDPVTVNIAVENVPVFDKLENHAQANREGLEETGFEILETDTTELNGKKAAYTKAVISVKVDDTNRLNWMLIQYTLLDGGKAYSVSFGAPQYLIDQYEPIFAEIADTFHTVD